ncbi:hypothetical protein ACFE04_025726 [Oxalis oulophora]
MDEFGVLTERYGLKPQGKSAPMSASKQQPQPPTRNRSSNSMNNGSTSSGIHQVDDLFGDFGSKSQNGSVKSGFDDLLSGFGSTANGRKAETAKSFFASADDPFDILNSTSTSTNTSFTDPLEEISKLSGNKKPGTTPTLRPPPKPAQVVKADKVKSSSASSVDELDDFAKGRVRSNSDGNSMKRQVNTKPSRYKQAENAPFEPQNKSHSADDLESFFAMSSRSSSAPRSRDTNLDSVFGEKRNDRKGPQVVNKATSGPSPSVKKTTPSINMVDDLSSIFGGASVFGEFEEVEGETDERRKARLGRQQRTHHRVAQAVADMNQRERQTQQEQEERQRIADAMDLKIKRWAAGKEGNMRALLSSLQQVLWPECGWHPVSLTDLITSTSVKKVYRKATLYVHPDKVQQKGATLQQKYIAEKVFDLLKEAWNKFDAEELR